MTKNNQKYLFLKDTPNIINTDWNFLFDLYFTGIYNASVLGISLAWHKQVRIEMETTNHHFTWRRRHAQRIEFDAKLVHRTGCKKF